MRSNGLTGSVSDLFVGDVFSVRDAEEFSEASSFGHRDVTDIT